MKLRRDPGIVGRVLLPDGTPAAGATVALALPGHGVRLAEGKLVGAMEHADPRADDKRLELTSRPLFVTADAEGRFRLPTELLPAVVYAVHDAGIAEVPQEELVRTPDIRLAAWGAIEGRAFWIDRPGANEKLYLRMLREAAGFAEVCSLEVPFVTDADGRFRAEKLPPWRGLLSRQGESRGGDSFIFPHQAVDIAAGQPTVVEFGGRGRTVVGRLQGLDSYEGVTLQIFPDRPFHLSLSTKGAPAPTELQLIHESEIGPLYFREQVPVDKDGTFRIAHVLPERYHIAASKNGRRNGLVRKLVIDVAAAPADEVFDAGEIRLFDNWLQPPAPTPKVDPEAAMRRAIERVEGLPSAAPRPPRAR